MTDPLVDHFISQWKFLRGLTKIYLSRSRKEKWYALPTRVSDRGGSSFVMSDESKRIILMRSTLAP